jgi:hypothetical protein
MAPLFLYQSEKLHAALNLSADERRAQVTSLSISEGVKSGAIAACVWLPMTALMYAKGNWFRNRLNASGRTAVVIMPPVFVFGFVSEQVASRLGNPEAFKEELMESRTSTLPIHKRYANFVHDHPFQNIAMISLPALVSVYLFKGTDHSLSFSQRIMHTRVLAQLFTVTTLLSTMGFYDYMGRHGRFQEPWEVVEQEEYKQK